MASRVDAVAAEVARFGVVGVDGGRRQLQQQRGRRRNAARLGRLEAGRRRRQQLGRRGRLLGTDQHLDRQQSRPRAHAGAQQLRQGGDDGGGGGKRSGDWQ